MATNTFVPAGPRVAAIAFLSLGLASVSAFAADTQISGVGNFHQVSNQVYRGAQPTNEGFQNLAKLGVKTIVDIREGGARAQAEEKMVKAAGMKYINIPFYGMTAPSNEQVKKVLDLFEDSTVGPVFVHCRRGADRTGTVCACYRITHDHWDNAKALAEAKSFGMAWVEKAMQNYVKNFRWAPTTPLAATAVAGTVQ